MVSCFREAARRVTGERLGRGACSVRPVTTRDSRRPRGRRWVRGHGRTQARQWAWVCASTPNRQDTTRRSGSGDVPVQRWDGWWGQQTPVTPCRCLPRRSRGSHRQSLRQNGADAAGSSQGRVIGVRVHTAAGDARTKNGQGLRPLRSSAGVREGYRYNSRAGRRREIRRRPAGVIFTRGSGRSTTGGGSHTRRHPRG